MEKLNFHSEDREVLRDLFTHCEGCELYFFHEKYLLSPAQLSRSIKHFVKCGVVEIENEIVRLTEFGRKWVLANRRSIFLKSENTFWKEPLTRARRIEGELYDRFLEFGETGYFPKMRKMNLGFFGHKEKGKK